MQSAGLAVLAAQLFDSAPGGGQLLFPGGALHGKEVAAHLHQRQAVFCQHGQGCHGAGRGKVELLPPHLAGGFLGALLGKLHPGQTQLGAGVLQKLHPLAGRFHEGQFQLRLENFGHDARKACPGAHVYHAPGNFRLAGKQQAVEEVLILDADGQVDLLVVVYKDLGKGIQLIQLGAGEGNVPCGTLFLQPLFVDHSVFLSVRWLG